MKNIVKKCKILFIIISLIFVNFSFSGCTYRQNIDELAYVIAIGLDVGETEDLKLTLQISRNTNSSESSEKSDALIVSMECSSISAGLNLFNNYINKEINLSHCTIIVFSEELASLGIADYIYTLQNNIQIHANANVIISKTTAENFLKNATPVLQQLSTKYYKIAATSSESTGYTESITFGEFFSDYTDTFQEAYAILGETNNITTIDAIGLAVFKDDVLTGELDGLETICHLIVTNKLNQCTIQIPSPINVNEKLDVNIRVAGIPKHDVQLINNTPYVASKININARLLSMAEDSNDLDEENKKEIERYINIYLKDNILKYFYKTSKILNSDIAGLGKYAVSDFIEWNDWIGYNWNYNYKTAFFNVDIHTRVRSGYLLLDT